jgi:SurA N-terminal domain
VTASRPAPGPRRAAAVVLLAVAVLGLCACDPKQAGSAAVVGGVRITETSVNADAQAVLAAFDAAGTQPPSNQTLLRTLVDRAIDNEVVEAAAKQEGITVTQGQIDKLIDDNGGRVKLSADFATRDGLWLPPGQIDELARSSLIQLALGNKLAPGGTATAVDTAVTLFKARLAAKLGVSVSPRYGTWSRTTLQITGNLDDLSQPAGGEPTPVPSASPAG